MNEQQARERATELARQRSQHMHIDFKILSEQIYYEGYMAAWRDAQ